MNCTPAPAQCGVCMTRPVCLLHNLYTHRHITPHEHPVSEHSFRRSAVLQTEGEVAGHLQVIKAGNGYSQRSINEGPAQPVSLIGSGHVLGAMSALGSRNLVTSIAYTDGRVCRVAMSPRMQESLYHRDSISQFGRFLHDSIDELTHWLDIHRTAGTTARVERALRHLGSRQRSSRIRVPDQGLLSRLIGCSREGLGRALQQLELRGSITRSGRGQIELHVTSSPAQRPAQLN